MKQAIKTPLIIISSIAVLYLAFVGYVKITNHGNPLFMDYRYNAVITQPLAKIGFADAQYKMGLFWFYGSGESEPINEEVEKAIYWWEKASARGNEKATDELAKAKERLDKLNAVSAESGGYAYWQAEEYYSRAVKFIEENNDVSALEYTMKALLVLEKLELQNDSLYLRCLNLISAIEEIAEKKE